jgi:chromosome segregation ATPase
MSLSEKENCDSNVNFPELSGIKPGEAVEDAFARIKADAGKALEVAKDEIAKRANIEKNFNELQSESKTTMEMYMKVQDMFQAEKQRADELTEKLQDNNDGAKKVEEDEESEEKSEGEINHVEQLKQTLESVEISNEVLRDQNEALKSESAELSSKFDTLTTKVDTLHQTIDDLKLQASSAAVNETDKLETIASEEQMSYKVASEKKIAELSRKLGAITKQNKDLRAKSSAAANKGADTTSTIETLEAEAKAHQEAMYAVESQLKKQADEIEQHKSSLVDARAKISCMQREAVESHEQHKAQIDQLLQVKAKGEEAFREAVEEKTKKIMDVQNDLRLLHRSNKKKLSDLQEEYKHDSYKERYQQAVVQLKQKEEQAASFQRMLQGVATVSENQLQTQTAIEEAERLLVAKQEEFEQQQQQQQQCTNDTTNAQLAGADDANTAKEAAASARIQELEKTIEFLKDQAATFEENVEMVGFEMETVREALKEKEDIVAKLEAVQAKQQEEFEQGGKQQEAKQQEELDQGIEQQEELTALKTQLLDLQAELESRDEKSGESAETLTAALADANAKASQLHSELAKEKEQVFKMKFEAIELKSTCTRSDEERAKGVETLVEMERQQKAIEEHKMTIEQRENVIEEHKMTIEQRELALQDAERNTLELKTELEQRKESEENKASELEELNQARAKTELQIQDLEQTMAHEKEADDAKVAELSGSLISAQTKIDELETELSSRMVREAEAKEEAKAEEEVEASGGANEQLKKCRKENVSTSRAFT